MVKFRLKFLGANETVTGSRTLVEVGKKKILVDCGLFQGPREIREFNWQEMPELQSADAVVLTHAHIDHSGYLPKLVREGFKNPIYCSEGTAHLCRVLLPDAGRLQEEDARYANETHHSRHEPALPLFTEKDAQKALGLLEPLSQEDWHEILPDVRIRLLRAGHILGSTFVQMSLHFGDEHHVLTFSGDIGHSRSNLLKVPRFIEETDTLVLESTYGDRRHPRIDPQIPLTHVINKVLDRGGTLIIPAFAVGRTQELIYLIDGLKKQKKIKPVPVYLDSPMAQEASRVYSMPFEDLKVDFAGEEPNGFRVVSSPEESMLLCMSDEPKVVISAAGMLSGGRVLHHLKQKLPDSKSGVLLVGYQATGTKGLLLKNGLPEISIHHKLVSIEAEVFVMEGLSAHGDCEDIMEWLGHFRKFPKKIFLHHGEPNASRSLAYMIRSHFDSEVLIPKMREVFSFY